MTMTNEPMTNDQFNTAYLSLGSNIGDRMAHLAAAEEKLTNHSDIEIVKLSKVYETEPWPRPLVDPVVDQVVDPVVAPAEEGGRAWFLNQVLEVKTIMNPDQLLGFCKEIESDLGRSKASHWGDREIDVDILLYREEVIETDHLVIPHRHMQDRQFILMPLVEIAPDLKDPISGKRYSTILNSIEDEHKVTPFF